MTTSIYSLVLRSPWETEINLGDLSVDQSESPATVKMTLAAALHQIANAIADVAWDGPVCPTPWLDTVNLTEFTAIIERDRAFTVLPGRCGAMPARAFRSRYPDGCLAADGHGGNVHYLDPVLADRARRRAERTSETVLSSCPSGAPQEREWRVHLSVRNLDSC